MMESFGDLRILQAGQGTKIDQHLEEPARPLLPLPLQLAFGDWDQLNRMEPWNDSHENLFVTQEWNPFALLGRKETDNIDVNCYIGVPKINVNALQLEPVSVPDNIKPKVEAAPSNPKPSPSQGPAFFLVQGVENDAQWKCTRSTKTRP